MTKDELKPFLDQISLPHAATHKGQNGKVMIIGGSELFHAASQWALTVVSRMVDMVFYASIPSNNEIIQSTKTSFSNGIVIRRQDIKNYIIEANVILIGPGMERTLLNNLESEQIKQFNEPTPKEWDSDTQKIVNYLLYTFPEKKWVIDAGALQMIAPELLNANCIITPHQQEFTWLMKKIDPKFMFDPNQPQLVPVEKFNNATVLLKGPRDIIFSPSSEKEQITYVSGGNEGMTKGGTGDVLAGLVAGLYAFSDSPQAVAVTASAINKQAGDALYKSVGPFFNATDLAHQIPQTMADVFGYLEK